MNSPFRVRTDFCLLYFEMYFCIILRMLHASRSKIVFKTAGVLLEEMRDRGLNALNYKVIVLDEVHERSVESDLVLVCVKQFLSKHHDLRSALCFSLYQPLLEIWLLAS